MNPILGETKKTTGTSFRNSFGFEECLVGIIGEGSPNQGLFECAFRETHSGIIAVQREITPGSETASFNAPTGFSHTTIALSETYDEMRFGMQLHGKARLNYTCERKRVDLAALVLTSLCFAERDFFERVQSLQEGVIVLNSTEIITLNDQVPVVSINLHCPDDEQNDDFLDNEITIAQEDITAGTYRIKDLKKDRTSFFLITDTTGSFWKLVPELEKERRKTDQINAFERTLRGRS